MIRHSASMFRRQGLVQVRWGIFVPLPSYTLSWVLREYFMINFCCSFQLKRIATRCEGEVPRRSGKCKSACGVLVIGILTSFKIEYNKYRSL